ncbi:MAG TPA: 3-hydroxyacyl-CoA dehydrogenase NAD-binding domain-containing protein [Thermoleophilia bacterium]|nr:3-hydroxyacyl-CoA dehydrogenase NAD-binding domain-containing protein [Thermoleophilia bacterium]
MSTTGAECVAVIGGGMMGVGVAQVFAAAGHEVALQDVSQEALERAPGTLAANLAFLAEHGLFSADGVADAVGRVRTTADLAEAAAGADVVVECVFEDLTLKQEVFERLDAVCPVETILCTNTSVMGITEIGARTVRKERVVGTHFWNPPYLIPLVEVVRTEHVDPVVVERTMDLLRRVGKHPIVCKKDVPGFVANRLQHALWREAISIVERGIADAETVDESIRYGPGLRLPILAPMENADMVGLDLTLAIHDYILPHLEASGEPSPLLRAKVEAGDLGFKSGKGFAEWTPESAEASRRRLAAYLVHVLGDPERGF